MYCNIPTSTEHALDIVLTLTKLKTSRTHIYSVYFTPRGANAYNTYIYINTRPKVFRRYDT